jgi:hypothetical protein
MCCLPKKVSFPFCLDKIEYLGHYISKEGVRGLGMRVCQQMHSTYGSIAKNIVSLCRQQQIWPTTCNGSCKPWVLGLA